MCCALVLFESAGLQQVLFCGPSIARSMRCAHAAGHTPQNGRTGRHVMLESSLPCTHPHNSKCCILGSFTDSTAARHDLFQFSNAPSQKSTGLKPLGSRWSQACRDFPTIWFSSATLNRRKRVGGAKHRIATPMFTGVRPAGSRSGLQSHGVRAYSDAPCQYRRPHSRDASRSCVRTSSSDPWRRHRWSAGASPQARPCSCTPGLRATRARPTARLHARTARSVTALVHVLWFTFQDEAVVTIGQGSLITQSVTVP